MSFATWLALAVGVFVVAPFVAHLLRRSRAEPKEFPPAHLVPVAEPVARQQSRLEDRLLLGIRAAMVLALAVLGATPLLRCSRLSLARSAGGSVALAIVVDDSLSMRARAPSGKSRFDLAIGGAKELLGTTREGDAVAIVLAGAPARIVLSATTDLAAARHALDQIQESDRATDLGAAVELARSLLHSLPHVDRRVVLLSDFAGGPIPKGEIQVWAPLADLRKPVDDCAVVSASSHGRRVSVSLACSTAQAARGRSLELVVTDGKAEPSSEDAGKDAKAAKAGEVVASEKLDMRPGDQTLSLDPPVLGAGLDARLSGTDDNRADDRAPVAPDSTGFGFGVYSDIATAGATTGGATVLEQALEALGRDLAVKPLATLPEDEKDLRGLGALLLDDPAGIAPEARGSLAAWLERGGVAVAFLGPKSENVQLGTTLEPFVRGALRWEHTKASSVDPASTAWLGAPGSSFDALAPKGRTRLDSALPDGAKVMARWDDGQPFLVEHATGRGVTYAVSLPSSPDQSDLALRPGFLALLEYFIDQAERRSGPKRTAAGTPWTFPATSSVEIEGPRGRAAVEALGRGSDSSKSFVGDVVGRYRVVQDGETSTRIVSIHSDEVTTEPREPDSANEKVVTGGVESKLDVSREVALFLLALFAGELVLRALRRAKPKRGRRKTDVPPTREPAAGG